MGNILFVYYRIPQATISFRLVADRQIEALKRLGHSIIVKDLLFDEAEQSDTTDFEGSIALVHPLFYYANWFQVSFERIMETLNLRHEAVYGIEVADSGAISDRFVRWANHDGIEGIMLPSRYSVESFRTSGVTASVARVPHGVEVSPADGTFDYLGKHDRPKILFFGGDSQRKGRDILYEIIPDFPNCTFVIKTDLRKRWSFPVRQKSNPHFVERWLSDTALASLYSNCDVFMALHRGGAFELHCLEALAYGMPVLAPNHGAVLDYLNLGNATLIDGRVEKGDHRPGVDHCGNVFRCDTEDAIGKLRSVLHDIEDHKARSRSESESIRRKYGWDQAVNRIVDFTSLPSP